MSNALLADMDTELHAAFADEGMADFGVYQPAVGVAQPCRIYVDRDAATIELRGVQAQTGIAVVTLLRAAVDGSPIAVVPANGATITVESDVFHVERRIPPDQESAWVLLCRT